MAIAEKLNVDYQIIYDTIKAKIAPLQERIKAEFEKTEEYATDTKHNEIIAIYKKERAKFSEKHGCSEFEYDYCFNVLGELMNENYYEKIVSDSKLRCSYQGLIMQ